MKLSIIIPVYREEKNIETTLNRIQKNVRTPHEILLIYHYKTDPTVKVIQKYMKKHKGHTIRLLQNANKSNNRVMKSIKMGFENAKGNARVVLMADLSDDITQIDTMYRLFEKGYDIVCASRYMKGGKKIGGPIVKTFLSRLAGLTLHYFFHIPTHDATNAFKLYNSKIFNKITVESVGGFEYSMEIILKAHSLGYKITEIPTVWVDRMEGSSNFKILAWIPEYLKWYINAYVLLFVKKNRFNWKLLLLLILLALASFWQNFSFYFFQDDYQFMWYALYHPFSFFLTFRHPGTPLEAILLTPIFGFHSWLWELTGIGIKVATAYLTGVFIHKITQSKIAGMLTSIFFVVSPAGMYAINAFNYHVPALALLFILLSLISLVTSLQEKKKAIWKFVVFLFAAFFLDPARVVPIFFIIPFLLLLFSKSKNSIYVKKFLQKFLLILVVVGAPLFLFWYVVVSKGAGTQFEVFLKGMLTNPKVMITKTKDIGNFAATITNLFFDFVYGLQPTIPKYETAQYSRTFGILGVGIFASALGSFVYFLKKKKSSFGIISFLIFWTYIFYLPNFLAEPRAPMTSINHYLFISSVGSIGLTAYLLTLLKKKWLLIFLSMCFVVLNIYKANTLLFLQYPYRSTFFIEKAWKTIVQTAPKKEVNDLFYFSGDTQWANYSILAFGPYHYLLSQQNSNISYSPLLITDERYAMSLICAQQKGSMQKQIPLSHVYAWNVISPGTLVENSTEQKKRFRKVSEEWNCSISE
ncbi:MAG TPA: glycosyltransferase [Candidatus Eisenbacteria bacterium]|nr:glycosyltransferase [Candidatus Eisenbacteria bacterium]